MIQNKALTVYRASAGSGKTFTLAAEYIKLLILDPKKYEEILAVTFTNKATEEMKQRIVSTLYGLANHLDDSKGYMEKIVKELKMSEEKISENAGIALHNILHNYNQFRVQTIDAFFQSVLRNMAKELGLGNNMKIAMNDKQIISDAVDNLFDTLDHDKELMDWVMGYIKEKMDENSSWDITGDVKKFGLNISKEFYKSHEHLLEEIDNETSFYRSYKDLMLKKKEEILLRYRKAGQGFFDILKENNFEKNNLSNKERGVAGYFIKLMNGKIDDEIFNVSARNAMENPEKWGGPGFKDKIRDLAENSLIPLLKKTEEARKKDAPLLKSIILTLSNLNKMRLLSGIRKEVDRLNRDNSRFLISNTQTTLNSMIAGGNNEAPFIFEKIGAMIKHIMIDEFQDTSTVQWENFKVLLNECISSSEIDSKSDIEQIHNLIVGDVKQSIYRFRSGDWRLLNGIGEDFTNDEINIRNLDINWRSTRNVVEFNNMFFTHAADVVGESIIPRDSLERQNYIEENHLPEGVVEQLDAFRNGFDAAYADVAQEIPEKKSDNGLVKMELLPSEGDEFTEEAMYRTLCHAKALMGQGIKQAEISIIVRENKEATTIANYFASNAPELRIVSEQAFTLGASPLVQMIVCAMKMLANPRDEKAKVTLIKLYTTYIKKEKISDGTLLTNNEVFLKYTPEIMKDENECKKMLSMPLYELTEHLFRNLSLSSMEGQATYASAFFDGLKKFLEDNGAIIEDFLTYWEDELQKKAIAVDGVDSIRIITIHKSKGLEFKHVIMPFCNWKIGPKAGLYPTLWCEITDKDFSKLPFIPVNYTGKKALANSIYENYGMEEWAQDVVDNLNLLYVAFTRAKTSLYAISNQDTKDTSRTKLIIETLKRICESAPEKAHIEGFDEFLKAQDAKSTKSKKKTEVGANETTTERKPIILTYGQLIRESEEKSENNDKEKNVFSNDAEAVEMNINSYENSSIEFRQSNSSMEFAKDVTDESDAKRMTTIGNIMHMLFSKIRTIDDVEKNLKQFEFDGILYDDSLTPEMLKNKLKEKFNNKIVSNWFSNKWTIFNECNIMRLVEGKIKEERPDRVITNGKETIVIDYKFGKRNENYKDQVKRYMSLLTEMNYPEVKGVIWYVNEDDGIEEVR